MRDKTFSLKNPRVPTYCLLVAWIMGVVGLVLGLFISPIMFARFGSLIVLFALIGEFALLKGELTRLYDRLSDDSDGLIHSKDFTPSRWHHKKGFLLHVTIVAGTVIWGFGDLFL